MSIDKKIKSVESEINRLKEQQKQENAMAEVLPLRFADNMAAFGEYIPEIYEQFKNYRPKRAFRFFCNENGIPNLLWLDDNVSLYGSDPYQQAKEQIEYVLSTSEIERFIYNISENDMNQVHVEYLNLLAECYIKAESVQEKTSSIPDSMPMAFMFGVGLGYQLGLLYERCSIKNLFIFEPDMDLFYASLFSFDWAPLLQYLEREKLGLHIFIGQDQDSIVVDLLTGLHKRGAFWIASMFAFWHYPSPAIFSLIERVAKEFYLLKTGWGFFDDNLFAIAHSATNICDGVPFLLKDRQVYSSHKDTPVFVVGNGPSLDETIGYIKKHQDSAIIIACGSTVSALYKAGVKPDICVAVERTKSMADFFDIFEDKEYLKDILFLSVDVIHPDCRKYFSRSALGFKHNEAMFSMLMQNRPDLHKFGYLPYVNPLVGNTGLSYALTLGFKKIYMFGLDSGYKEKNHHHSRHSAYYEENGSAIKELTDAVTAHESFLVPANFGGEISADCIFGLSANSMSKVIAMYPDVTCYNCSDGALVRGAIPLRYYEADLNEQCIDKKNIVEDIYANCFEPLSISIGCIKEALSVERFDELVRLMVIEWEDVSLNKRDMSEMMQRHYDYLNYFLSTRQSHIHRILVGSINYYFSFITTILYSFNESDAYMKLLNEAKCIVINFMREIKRMYPYALSHVDKNNLEIIGHFRKIQ
ncbi:motility associated factor glycosyltransferase family protein [Aeromonas veronii]